ncbi:hypothetical protein MKZ38_007551 [Zalerion maritima]|uniref:Uncharacterized protein n=1 Tax=Zalerion maritima TaxID=339359 RepID=A0AAD5RIS5_9PEZI|nr:hypothetical protein MKZ38_007551 [Zalerion maritima]
MDVAAPHRRRETKAQRRRRLAGQRDRGGAVLGRKYACMCCRRRVVDDIDSSREPDRFDTLGRPDCRWSGGITILCDGCGENNNLCETFWWLVGETVAEKKKRYHDEESANMWRMGQLSRFTCKGCENKPGGCKILISELPSRFRTDNVNPYSGAEVRQDLDGRYQRLAKSQYNNPRCYNCHRCKKGKCDFGRDLEAVWDWRETRRQAREAQRTHQNDPGWDFSPDNSPEPGKRPSTAVTAQPQPPPAEPAELRQEQQRSQLPGGANTGEKRKRGKSSPPRIKRRRLILHDSKRERTSVVVLDWEVDGSEGWGKWRKNGAEIIEWGDILDIPTPTNGIALSSSASAPEISPPPPGDQELAPSQLTPAAAAGRMPDGESDWGDEPNQPNVAPIQLKIFELGEELTKGNITAEEFEDGKEWLEDDTAQGQAARILLMISKQS